MTINVMYCSIATSPWDTRKRGDAVAGGSVNGVELNSDCDFFWVPEGKREIERKREKDKE